MGWWVGGSVGLQRTFGITYSGGGVWAESTWLARLKVGEGIFDLTVCLERRQKSSTSVATTHVRKLVRVSHQHLWHWHWWMRCRVSAPRLGRGTILKGFCYREIDRRVEEKILCA